MSGSQRLMFTWVSQVVYVLLMKAIQCVSIFRFYNVRFTLTYSAHHTINTGFINLHSKWQADSQKPENKGRTKLHRAAEGVFIISYSPCNTC